jgi:hypothetical protein
MAITVLSGTSGALYYKPAGTTGTFPETGVTVADDEITVQPYLNLKVGDPVVFSVINSQTGGAGSGTLPAGIAAATTYFVIAYTAATGVMEVSATLGGASITITDDGTAVAPNEFQVAYAEYAAVGQVQSWSFEISRAEIDVTTIGQTAGQYAPFRAYIPGFADGSGTATVYVTNEDVHYPTGWWKTCSSASKWVAASSCTPTSKAPEALSRSIAMDAVLLSASLNINPDDAQQVEITFRPSGAPTFDFSTTV